MPDTPDTLPADFEFDKAPDTLPADFFTRPGSTLSIQPPPKLPADLPAKVYEHGTEMLPVIGGFGGALAGGPIGAGLGGAAGELMRRAVGPKPSGTMQQALQGAATEGAAQAGMEYVGGRLLPRALGAMLPSAERVYQSALKPPLGSKIGRKVPEIVETGLRERIVPGAAGSERVGAMIDDINGQIATKLQNLNAQGVTVEPGEVLKRLDSLRDFYSKSADPRPFLKAIDSIEEGFKMAHGGTSTLVTPPGSYGYIPGARPIPIQEAQGIKQTEYAILRKKYGEMGTAESEARKTIARGLKEEIEKAYPEIRDLNDRERRLIDLDGAIDRFVNRESSHQMTGIGTPLATTAIGVATGSPLAAKTAGGLRAALDAPSIKARIAFALDALRRGEHNTYFNVPNLLRGGQIAGAAAGLPGLPQWGETP